MAESKRPLKGVRVVELATFIAAPSCCRYLADLGAEVIKVESAAGDPLRYTAVNEGRPAGEIENVTFDLDNANKSSIVLNLKTEKGMEAFHHLVSSADIFVTNWRLSALERTKIDYLNLKQKYPALVYGMISGYGEIGPDKELPGFDFTAYFARGGILGTLLDKDSMPINPIAGFGDHQAGMYLASGLLAALYAAKMTGKGEKVVVSLFHTALWAVSVMLQSSQYGDPSTQFPISRKHIANPLQVAHKTKDGRWIQIAMPQYDHYYPIFMEIIGRKDLIGDERFFPQVNLINHLEEFYETLKDEMSKRTLIEWIQVLSKADIPYAVAKTWNELLVDEQAWASNCFYKMAYPNGKERTLVRPPVMFSEIGLPPYNRAPYKGEQTRKILADLGYSEDQISAMLNSGEAGIWRPDASHGQAE